MMTLKEAKVLVDEWLAEPHAEPWFTAARTLRHALAESEEARSRWCKSALQFKKERDAALRERDAAMTVEQRLETIPSQYSWTLHRFWNRPWAVNMRITLLSPHGELIEPIEPVYGKSINEVVTDALAALDQEEPSQ